MNGSKDDQSNTAASNESSSDTDSNFSTKRQSDRSNIDEDALASSSEDDAWTEVEAVLSNPSSDSPGGIVNSIISDASDSSTRPLSEADITSSEQSLNREQSWDSKLNRERTDDDRPIPVALVETAFLASTASLLWLVSYYLSIGPWMRIFFPAPIALVYLRWGRRSAWMSAIVSGLLLSVLMGPYLSLLFLIPYGVLGVQLGFLWRRQTNWGISIFLGTIVSTLSFFFRVWVLSIFIGEDLWVYLTGRITDLLEWFFNLLVNWGFVGVSVLGQPDIIVVQIATVVMVICSDIVYLFTIHLAVWILFERLKTPIPDPPQWVQVLLEE